MAFAQVYSEQIGNLMMDALSAKKYYHFVRLMGRAASHIALECALQTHPQAAIICEEVHQNKRRLADIVHEVCMLIAGQERLLMASQLYGFVLAMFLREALGRTLCLFRDCLQRCCCDLKCCMRDNTQICRRSFTLIDVANILAFVCSLRTLWQPEQRMARTMASSCCQRASSSTCLRHASITLTSASARHSHRP